MKSLSHQAIFCTDSLNLNRIVFRWKFFELCCPFSIVFILSWICLPSYEQIHIIYFKVVVQLI